MNNFLVAQLSALILSLLEIEVFPRKSKDLAPFYRIFLGPGQFDDFLVSLVIFSKAHNLGYFARQIRYIRPRTVLTIND